jgi:hypothetical protein
MQMELVMRFGLRHRYSLGQEEEDGSGMLAIVRAGHDGAAHAGRTRGENMTTVAEFDRRRG